MAKLAFEPLDEMIERTEPSFSSVARPETVDIVLCAAPLVLGQMLALREELKKANREVGISPLLHAVNVYRQAELNARIGRMLLERAAKNKSVFLEGKDLTGLEVTTGKMIVYREK